MRFQNFLEYFGAVKKEACCQGPLEPGVHEVKMNDDMCGALHEAIQDMSLFPPAVAVIVAAIRGTKIHEAIEGGYSTAEAMTQEDQDPTIQSIRERSVGDDHGSECEFFDLGDGTGWKIYRTTSSARIARDAQVVLNHYDLAPDVLSDSVTIYDEGGRHELGWGYITEVVESRQDHECSEDWEQCLNDACPDGHGFDYYLLEEELERHGLWVSDLHHGNVGIKDGTIVVIDTGACSGISTMARPDSNFTGEYVRLDNDNNVVTYTL